MSGPATSGTAAATPRAVAVADLLGGLTAMAQGRLPHGLEPLANSVGSWALVAVLLGAAAGCTMRRAATVGTLTLLGLLAGYVATDEVRGFASGSRLVVFWSVAALLAGPLLGWSGRWLRDTGRPAAAGAAIVASALVGDGVYGLTRIAGKTGAVYWLASIGCGLSVLAVTLLWRVRDWPMRAAAVAATGCAAGGYCLALGAAGGLI